MSEFGTLAQENWCRVSTPHQVSMLTDLPSGLKAQNWPGTIQRRKGS
jgi:hypothetical protein